MKKKFVLGGLLGVVMVGMIVFGKSSLTYAVDCADGDLECLKKQIQFTSPKVTDEETAKYVKELSEIDRKNNCIKDPTTSDCEKSYSCESLFSDPTTARKCNRERCVAQKGYVPSSTAPQTMDFPCNCKYGIGGDITKDTGIPLNTNFPFIGRCLVKKGSATDPTASALSAFPTIVSALSKMLVVVILAIGVIMVIIGGIQRAMGDAKAGKEKIKKVAIGFLLLGAMGAILALINPNFFK